MSSGKEEHDSIPKGVEGAESSDNSLSDSWTVLDSSHFKEDGDLSDAESVEVLGTEEHPTDDICSEIKNDEYSSEIPSPLPSDFGESAATATSTEKMKTTFGTESQDPNTAATEDVNNETSDSPEKPPKQNKRYFFDGAPVEIVGETFSAILLEIAIYSLFIDLLILTYFGFSSLAGVLEKPGSNIIKGSQSHQQYEIDPLALQLSHVLAEWKKNPSEDHSLDRHVLKTLFLYYGGSTELADNLHSLTARVQKNNEIIRRQGKETEWFPTDWQHNRMIVSAHLAHSVACILGKQDNDRSLPANLFAPTNSTIDDMNDDLSPEPGFWLNDWHLPQYFKANDTYYRVDMKTVLPPMRNLFVHLGSAKWNEYFWKLYHQDVVQVNEKYEEELMTVDNKVSENELDSEETERSPLDLTAAEDLVPPEQSSHNVVNPQENFDEQVQEFYPLFVTSGDSEKVLDEGNESGKFKPRQEQEHMQSWGGNYFEMLDREDYLDGSERDEFRHQCLGDSCESYKRVIETPDSKGNGVERKGRLSQLFEELGLDKPPSTVVYGELMNDPPLFDDVSKVSESPQKGKLSELFEELSLDEPQNDNFGRHPGGYMEKAKIGKLGDLFNDEYNINNNFEEKVVEKSLKGKLVSLFEEFNEPEVGEEIGKDFEEFSVEHPVKRKKGNPNYNSFEHVDLFNDNHYSDNFFEEKVGENSVKGKLVTLFEEFNEPEAREEMKKDFEEVTVEQPVKGKRGKPKHKSSKQETELKGKGKQKKKEKGKLGINSAATESKKKMKRKNRKDVKFEGLGMQNGNIHVDYVERNHRGKKVGADKIADWNTRMAQGREKLRALSDKENEQIWLFERARARRDMREETFSE